MMYLDNPYPKEGKVIVLNLTSQLVDSTGRPIPLSDVSAHRPQAKALPFVTAAVTSQCCYYLEEHQAAIVMCFCLSKGPDFLDRG